jgi:phosphate transport system substrate-binding protein
MNGGFLHPNDPSRATGWEQIRALLVATLVTLGLGTHAAPVHADVLRLGGSGGTLGTMRLLVKEFRKTHPGLRIDILPSLGTSGGIKAVSAGAIDIAVTARPLAETERRSGLIELEYGRTPLVFATARHRSGISVGELTEIWSGKLTSWPDGSRIRLVLRPASESDTALLRQISPEMDRAVSSALAREGMIFAVTDQESADALEKIPGALGTSTLAQIISEHRSLKALSLDGVAPSAQTVGDGTYRYFKRLFIVTGPRPRLPAREFAVFARSERARTILLRTGHWVIGKAGDR